MHVEWYCRLMGAELGPFSGAQLLDMARKHRVTPEDLVKKGTFGEWVPAYRVKGLFVEADMATSIPVGVPTMQRQNHSGPATTAEPPRQSRIDPPKRDEWFFISAGQKFGPMPFERLQEQISAGRLHAHDRVWSTAAPKWCEAHRVRGLTFDRAAGTGS
jgi:hypothetical protein